jgi:hypothetical protein
LQSIYGKYKFSPSSASLMVPFEEELGIRDWGLGEVAP